MAEFNQDTRVGVGATDDSMAGYEERFDGYSGPFSGNWTLEEGAEEIASAMASALGPVIDVAILSLMGNLTIILDATLEDLPDLAKEITEPMIETAKSKIILMVRQLAVEGAKYMLVGFIVVQTTSILICILIMQFLACCVGCCSRIWSKRRQRTEEYESWRRRNSTPPQVLLLDLPAPRNARQETAISAQIVLKMWFLDRDFGVCAPAMPCPVRTQRMMLLLRCARYWRSVRCYCHAMSGTGIAYDATAMLCPVLV
mmetsp:Transcript_15763/g.37314  ORF Transcript_15763/g.37314 Transcript_15763/m.37314 type:complete len:257 (+) Transcript_15763:222-992(+)